MNFGTSEIENTTNNKTQQGVFLPHLYKENTDIDPVNLVSKINEARSKLSIGALDIFNSKLSEIDEVYVKASEGTLLPQQLAELNNTYRTSVEKLLAGTE